MEGTNRGTNTSPVPNPDKQEEVVIIPNTGPHAGITPAEMQEETLQPESLEIQDTRQVNPMQDQDSESQIQDDATDSQLNDEEHDSDIPDDQTSKASQEDNYHTAIDDDEQDDTIQFGKPVTQPFLSRSVRVPITEVGCLSFTLTRLFTGISATLTSRYLFTNPRDGSMVRYVFN